MSNGGITKESGPNTWTGREVTITVPAGIAGDLDQMNRVIKNVMTELGHPGCHSGFDLRFRQSLDFVVSPKGDIAPGIAQPFLG
ncbi:hypothetical protein GCM10018790_75640 [Kitasatospora xanthocidica]|uniref:hypothetical protein n=1 Tax=Kitasatospora xanthocidica TaxID=83382 RepID=UPI001672C05F|nr:hypothetical protein [Kitasatospora xanthocidica]GHF86994.1 hypothetical protein GCM10018790_75640 [Kitasatospora xanthocidica]